MDDELDLPPGIWLDRVMSTTTAPDLPYGPPECRPEDHPIAVIGCGNISERHLRAYSRAGYRVVALCDIELARAEEKRDEFFPEADVHREYEAVLARDDVDIVDLPLHPEVRLQVIEDAIEAGKHVLSQKPFVLDVNEGRRLVEAARERGVKLAVNQSGRWAPHFSYLRELVDAGTIGTPSSARFAVHRNHNGIAGTPFEDLKHVILYDFGIHWFDIARYLFPSRTPERVYASVTASATQEVKPPLLGQAVVEFENAQCSMVFDGDTRYGAENRTRLIGGEGSAVCTGPHFTHQEVTLYTPEGTASPELEGGWYPTGFEGTMAELMRSIEADDEPANGAMDNLGSLELCFAAVASAEDHEPKVPGTVERLPDS